MESSFVRLTVLACVILLAAPIMAQTAHIVYQREQSGGEIEIWRAEPDGDHDAAITCPGDVGVLHQWPTILPPGRWIYFDVRDTENGAADIYKIRQDGSGDPIQVTDNTDPNNHSNYDPDAGSHNGTKLIYFISTRDGSQQLAGDVFKMDPAGSTSSIVNLTNTDSCYEYDPAWCGPDQVIFARLESSATGCGDPDDVDFDLFIIDNDGTNESRVTDNNEGPFGLLTDDRYPACKPGTSRYVAFSRTLENDCPLDCHLQKDIIELDRTTSIETNLSTEKFAEIGDEDGVTYSPAGDFVAFYHEESDPAETGIWTLVLDGEIDIEDYEHPSPFVGSGLEFPDWGELLSGAAVGCP